jgi:hypothetical protein
MSARSPFSPEDISAVKLIAARYGLEPAAILAIAETESAGVAFAVVNGRQEPLIRFEGHYFDDRLTGAQKTAARSQGLASPHAGAVKNPASQAARWALLNRAAAINHDAAYESCSWGLGQVMGAHWKTLGFKSVDELVAMARKDVAGQIELMTKFIVATGLKPSVQNHDWTAVARGYNGPAYRQNRYDEKIRAAYQRYQSPAAISSDMLRMGSHGAKVRELQTLLRRAGATVAVDGDFGPSTKAALETFQRQNGLAVDGLAGPETMAALAKFRQDPAENLAAMPVADVPQVQDAAKGLAPVAIVMSIRDQIADLAMQLMGVDVSAAQTIANTLMALSAVIGVGLAVYGLYGWLHSRKTYVGLQQ